MEEVQVHARTSILHYFFLFLIDSIRIFAGKETSLEVVIAFQSVPSEKPPVGGGGNVLPASRETLLGGVETLDKEGCKGCEP